MEWNEPYFPRVISLVRTESAAADQSWMLMSVFKAVYTIYKKAMSESSTYVLGLSCSILV